MMDPKTYDVIIVGGAVMGSSLAYHLLAMEPRMKLAVVERDPTYSRASTTLSLGGVRIQFSLKENIQISLYAQNLFSRFEEEMAIAGERIFLNFRQEGYLFLVDPKGRGAAEESLALQKQLGGAAEWWPPGLIREKFPLIDADDFAGGTFEIGRAHV